jgi:hypothetical protein
MLSELAQLRLFSARLYFRRLGSFVRMMGRKRTG